MKLPSNYLKSDFVIVLCDLSRVTTQHWLLYCISGYYPCRAFYKTIYYLCACARVSKTVWLAVVCRRSYRGNECHGDDERRGVRTESEIFSGTTGANGQRSVRRIPWVHDMTRHYSQLYTYNVASRTKKRRRKYFNWNGAQIYRWKLIIIIILLKQPRLYSAIIYYSLGISTFSVYYNMRNPLWPDGHRLQT